MKRLLKYEWKRYLMAICLTSIFMIGYRMYAIQGWGTDYMKFYKNILPEDFAQGSVGEYSIDDLCKVCGVNSMNDLCALYGASDMDEFYRLYGADDINEFYEQRIGEITEQLYESVIIILARVSYGYTDMENVKIIMLMLLVMKIFQYWTERESYGREFIVTLPVKGRMKKGFYVLANGILVTASMVIYTAGILIYLKNIFQHSEVEIPWFSKAVLGEMMTSIAYMLMLLGIVEFLEILFVDGIMKMIGTVSMFGMSAYMLEAGFNVFWKIKWIQKLYGFLTLQAAGKQCYERLADEHDGGWTHNVANLEILFQGQWLRELVSEKKPWAAEWINDVIGMEESSRLFDFSNLSTYAGLVVCYLLIGCVAAGITIWLSGKLDVSKNGFYFSFGRYLFSVLVAGSFFTICMIYADAWWHKCLVVMGSVCVGGILAYKTAPGKVIR